MRIEVKDLQYSYPAGVQALRGVSLTIESGEHVAIVGQNGAGKTTLVRHFNGLLQPASGEVQIGGWDTREHSVAKLASRVGYVFQNPDEQLFSRDVKTEVAFGPKNLGFNAEQIQGQIEEALALTELADKTETNPYDLSPTWRKMVAIASVIAMDTPIVIFDEPTTGQDAANIARIANVIKVLRERGKTVITITHDIDFCAENFERVIAMSQGTILLDGNAGDVFAKDDILAATYVDPPQLTRLGKKLGLKKIIKKEGEFIAAYQAEFSD